MHDTLVADALRPAPVCVLNLPLVEYSLGHEVQLLRRRNALLLSSPAEFSLLPLEQQIFAIREAVWLCSEPASNRDRIERPGVLCLAYRWNAFKRSLWQRGIRRFTADDYALACAEFRNYLAAGRPFPPTPSAHAVSVLYENEKDANGRSFGQPIVLTLFQFVVRERLHAEARLRSAWDYPFASASWLYFASAESDGAYRIENPKERQVQAERDQFEREIAEEQKTTKTPSAPSGEKTPTGATGLATTPPDELKGHD